VFVSLSEYIKGFDIYNYDGAVMSGPSETLGQKYADMEKC